MGRIDRFDAENGVRRYQDRLGETLFLQPARGGYNPRVVAFSKDYAPPRRASTRFELVEK